MYAAIERFDLPFDEERKLVHLIDRLESTERAPRKIDADDAAALKKLLKDRSEDAVIGRALDALGKKRDAPSATRKAIEAGLTPRQRAWLSVIGY